ncbi:MAG: hypothetical protein HXS54_06375, partial [Theionarchaea archaeon]|nr:hypothetical protein [Theionarchaea archaeon]
PIDPLLDDEQSLTNKIDVIQYGESLAAKATSTADVFVVTVGAPETGQISTELFFSKAEYQDRVENYPGLKAGIDMQMKSQLIKRKNLELVKGIFANKANAVTKTATGHLSYADLLKLYADMSKRGYTPTHFLTTHALMADLLMEKDATSTYNKMALDRKLSSTAAVVYEVPHMGWTIVSTKWMDHTEVAGTGYCIAWNYESYVEQVIRARPQARMYDMGDTGINMLRGTIWWEEYGVGPFPASGDQAVAYTYVL